MLAAAVSAPPTSLSAAYQLPWQFQLSGSFIATPVPSVAANYDGHCVDRRPPGLWQHRRRDLDQRQPDRAQHDVPDYKKQLDLRLSRNFRFGSRRIQAFADIFNALNSGTVLRRHETYAATGTNAWLTPLTIMDARYLRFGVQISF